MRVLQVISSSETSGAERHVLSLAGQLQSRSHEVKVISAPSGWLPKELRRQNIPIAESSMQKSGWLRTALHLARKARKENIDLIHSHLTRATYIAGAASLLANKPLLATVHVCNRDPVYKWVGRRKNKLIAVSNFVRGILFGRGVPDRFIETVYNGTDFLDIPCASNGEIKRELKLSHESRMMGVVGRVCLDKGHMLLISALPAAFREHPNAHIVFVGRIDAQFKTDLNTAISTHDLESRVTLTGNRTDVPLLLDAFEFTAMPSRREAFGVAAIEAMARERAVIASRIGGLPEVVKHGQTGLLFDLRTNEISDAIHYMLSHREECTQMGKQGRDLVEERFTLKQMVDKLETIYLECAGLTRATTLPPSGL